MKKILKIFGYYHINDIIKLTEEDAELWERNRKELNPDSKFVNYDNLMFSHYRQAILEFKYKLIKIKINGINRTNKNN